MKQLILLCLLSTVIINAQNKPIVIPLWENGSPGFEDKKDIPEDAKEYWVKNVHNPSITVFKPEKPNGTAVLIFPGGGHKLLVFDEEGTKAAKFLNQIGITGIVLKYRLFREENSPYKMENAVEDALRAMRVIRSRANELGIKKNQLGVFGFSAGGELVNAIAFKDFKGNTEAKDKVERESANPNFNIQIYPGPVGIPEVVGKNAIPAFLLASNNDKCCSETALKLLQAYRKAGAPVEAHFYSKEGHGFNMGDRSKYIAIQSWPDRLVEWFIDNKFFRK